MSWFGFNDSHDAITWYNFLAGIFCIDILMGFKLLTTCLFPVNHKAQVIAVGWQQLFCSVMVAFPWACIKLHLLTSGPAICRLKVNEKNQLITSSGKSVVENRHWHKPADHCGTGTENRQTRDQWTERWSLSFALGLVDCSGVCEIWLPWQHVNPSSLTVCCFWSAKYLSLCVFYRGHIFLSS